MCLLAQESNLKWLCLRLFTLPLLLGSLQLYFQLWKSYIRFNSHSCPGCTPSHPVWILEKGAKNQGTREIWIIEKYLNPENFWFALCQKIIVSANNKNSSIRWIRLLPTKVQLASLKVATDFLPHYKTLTDILIKKDNFCELKSFACRFSPFSQ